MVRLDRRAAYVMRLVLLTISLFLEALLIEGDLLSDLRPGLVELFVERDDHEVLSMSNSFEKVRNFWDRHGASHDVTDNNPVGLVPHGKRHAHKIVSVSVRREGVAKEHQAVVNFHAVC